MIYCQQINDDRLGNQLFRFANAYAHAKRNGDKLKCNWHLNYKHAMSSVEFGVPDKIVFNYAQPNLGYDEIPYIDGMNLDGYFQSEKYFEDYAGEIREMFATKTDISQLGAIHVRRGDYLHLQGTLPVLPMGYYDKAIELAKEHWGINDFKVYSDDPEWCKANFPYEVSDGTEIEDFESMQNHSCHIIANSTFSWWAAWLNGHDKVIAPKTWFGHPNEFFIDRDIVPGRWWKI